MNRITSFLMKTKWDIVIGVPCCVYLYNEYTQYRGTINFDKPKMLHRGYILQCQAKTKIMVFPITFKFWERHSLEDSSPDIDFQNDKEQFEQLCINNYNFKNSCIWQSKHPLIAYIISLSKFK